MYNSIHVYFPLLNHHWYSQLRKIPVMITRWEWLMLNTRLLLEIIASSRSISTVNMRKLNTICKVFVITRTGILIMNGFMCAIDKETSETVFDYCGNDDLANSIKIWEAYLIRSAASSFFRSHRHRTLQRGIYRWSQQSRVEMKRQKAREKKEAKRRNMELE
jgi:hypothetical protein